MSSPDRSHRSVAEQSSEGSALFDAIAAPTKLFSPWPRILVKQRAISPGSQESTSRTFSAATSFAKLAGKAHISIIRGQIANREGLTGGGRWI